VGLLKAVVLGLLSPSLVEILGKPVNAGGELTPAGHSPSPVAFSSALLATGIRNDTPSPTGFLHVFSEIPSR
jgi:hypothetical protein